MPLSLMPPPFRSASALLNTSPMLRTGEEENKRTIVLPPPFAKQMGEVLSPAKLRSSEAGRSGGGQVHA
jgi:hypothetical protein